MFLNISKDTEIHSTCNETNTSTNIRALNTSNPQHTFNFRIYTSTTTMRTASRGLRVRFHEIFNILPELQDLSSMNALQRLAALKPASDIFRSADATDMAIACDAKTLSEHFSAFRTFIKIDFCCWILLFCFTYIYLCSLEKQRERERDFWKKIV